MDFQIGGICTTVVFKKSQSGAPTTKHLVYVATCISKHRGYL